MVSEPELAPGTLVDGSYLVKGVLGKGGMSCVYEAEDLRYSRRVALKVLLDRSSHDSEERFQREARAKARAAHPGVVTVFADGVDPELGLAYIVLERLQGQTLAEAIAQRGRLDAVLTVKVGLEVADTLDALHALGIVHRDLKPSNIFLCSRARRGDEVKLLDFGVAKQSGLPTLTATGQIFGTLAYMAPEQLSDFKRVDARCDLYALGAVLFECLTGERLYKTTNMAALALDVAFGRMPGLLTLEQFAATELASVVRRCLHKAPADRFADARALYDALAACPV